MVARLEEILGAIVLRLLGLALLAGFIAWAGDYLSKNP